MDKTKALGEEKIPKLLLKFSVPCVMGLLISALYNIVDQIFIGNSKLGYLGNAATGIPFPIICIANAFAWCVGDGAATFLSICAGRKDTENAHKCVGTGIATTIIISLILAIISLSFMQPLLRLFGATDQTIDLAVQYFTITACTFPVYLMINVMNSMIRADGSPGYAMISMISGAVMNIILDPIFIYAFDWGIRGAAIATTISQVFSLILCLIYFRKPKTFKLCKSSFKIDPKMLLHLTKLGGATFITQISIVAMNLVSNICLAKYGVLSRFGGDIPISVFAIQTKVYTIVNNVVVGLALGCQPILGYNYGANKMDRVRQTYRLLFIISFIVGALATVMFEFFPQVIVAIFGGGDALYLEFAVKTFRIYHALTILTALVKATSIFFQAIGKSIQSMIASVVRDIMSLVPLTIILCAVMEKMQAGNGIMGILIAAPIADIISAIVVTVLTVIFFVKLHTTESSLTQECVIKPSHRGVIVTISREHGSKGKQIGKMLAEKLNIPFYYKEMTALAAKESGLSKQFISDINKNAPALFHQLYLSTEVVEQAILAQESIIKKIADNGSCVIVGRAADFVLRDYENVVKVFLYAPKDVRINNIMQMYGDDYNSAKTNLLRADKARASYYNSITHKKWSDEQNYDICLDTSIGENETCEKLIQFINDREIIKE